ncbi:hypothetical protein [Pedobacter sp. MC2016-24]|uniref:hypothetical protein n=1 Tax=Pedobacter sp. MC2016-24 TaxID=2780090 RepID=UPI00188179D9|nr:hypothetical protein [Pedobacter sp. MC2016-24]MBE9599820.1 hypothetical protein [Pedobacter sp. MC2016-24]
MASAEFITAKAACSQLYRYKKSEIRDRMGGSMHGKKAGLFMMGNDYTYVAISRDEAG